MHLLDFLFPKRCLTCWRFGKYFCDRCASTIKTIQPSETICPVCERLAFRGMTHHRCLSRYGLDGLMSFFHYNGIVREAVKVLKYRRVTDLAQEFVELIPSDSCEEIFQVCHSRESGNPVFVPIPLHASRYRDRGFNQAEVLGRFLADRLHIPIRTDILRRTKKTTPQVEMKDRKDRLKNMKNVFSIPDSKFLIPNSLVLFDDVFTTGATMRAAGETLKRAGTRFVWAVTMAR
ncbi:ComF family protein [Candidatus Gottesmanbacteria bacterium]|nr:ComF family protein [Candidatus Gottesmanbacteria bacterium]